MSAGICASTGTSATRWRVPRDHLPSAPVPLHAAELVEEGRREEHRVPAPVPVDGHGDRAPARPEGLHEPADHLGLRERLIAERHHGRRGAGPKRVEPRPERRRLSLGVARVHHGPNGQTGQGARDGLRVPAENDHRVVQPGRQDLLDRDADQRTPVRHRQRQLLPAHAARRPGCEDDCRDHHGPAREHEGPGRPRWTGTPGPLPCCASRATWRPWPARWRARAPAACTRA